jgi:imidazolonepropionase-like amidohydrolase
MAEQGIFLVPTLKAISDILSGDRPGVPGWILEKCKHVQEHSIRSIQCALEMGIPIAMGTDAATPYNFHGENAMELVLMADAGLSAMQTIVAATSTAARALGWDSWLGTLEQGKVADLLVIAGNPLDNLHLLTDRRHIELVIKDGRIVARPPSVKLEGIPEAILAGAWICCDLPSPGLSMMH